MSRVICVCDDIRKGRITLIVGVHVHLKCPKENLWLTTEKARCERTLILQVLALPRYGQVHVFQDRM